VEITGCYQEGINLFKIDKNANSLCKIKPKSFTDLGFKERDHLQEWIAKNTDVFDEELLIIQKEFSGFNDTNERLDLLALDKQGNLVIIENKLDDSGKDVTWQSLKYASYCSSLIKEQIREIYQSFLDRYYDNENAVNNLQDFFNAEYEDLSINQGLSQRIIIVAANFRKEVTSTVLWLMNYKLRIQCFKVTPYALSEDEIFLTFEQIIPMKDSEEYMISMAAKTQADISIQEEAKNRHNIRTEFWKRLLPVYQKEHDLFSNISPGNDSWISAGSGLSGVAFNFVISQHYARVELLIQRPEKEENKFIFDQLDQCKDEIEQQFGTSLIWERIDSKKACRIKYQKDSCNVFNEEDWDEIIVFLVEAMPRFHAAIKAPLLKVRSQLQFMLKGNELGQKS
jgi:hypothetical protein